MERYSVVAKENQAVENEYDADDVATEVCAVGEHQKPICFLDRAADGLVTSTKVVEVAGELASITDTPAELLAQLDELIVQQSHHREVHRLRKRPRANHLQLEKDENSSHDVEITFRQTPLKKH